MKKLLSKSFVAVIAAAFVFPSLLPAQIKTTFTTESRPSNSMPTGMVANESSGVKNAVDKKMPSKTRGIERYQKKTIFNESIPDSFLFYRNQLNDRQKIAYDIVYKTLMNVKHDTELTVKTTIEEFNEAMNAVRYDNPEAFWWSGDYTYYWNNSDRIVTSVHLDFWLEDSKIEQAYNDFWAMTTPIIFYASRLPDDMSKIKYIHDYICLSTEYDYPSLDAGQIGGKLQTSYSCAVEYKTVCAGYASCFCYYLQNLGIPCISVWGSGHQWNFLKVNGQYYQMDVTWDDTQVIPQYYNLQHADMQKVDMHGLEPLAQKVVNAHPSTSTAMSYLPYFGPLIEGSPYTYQELGNFYQEIDHPEKAKVYQSEPQLLYSVSNPAEFRNLVQLAFYSANSDSTRFSFMIPDKSNLDVLLNNITQGNVGDWIGELLGKYHYNYTYNYYTLGNSVIMDLDLTATY